MRAWDDEQAKSRVLEALRPSRRAPLTPEERADPAIVAALGRILLGDPNDRTSLKAAIMVLEWPRQP